MVWKKTVEKKRNFGANFRKVLVHTFLTISQIKQTNHYYNSHSFIESLLNQNKSESILSYTLQNNSISYLSSVQSFFEKYNRRWSPSLHLINTAPKALEGGPCDLGLLILTKERKRTSILPSKSSSSNLI